MGTRCSGLPAPQQPSWGLGVCFSPSLAQTRGRLGFLTLSNIQVAPHLPLCVEDLASGVRQTQVQVRELPLGHMEKSVMCLGLWVMLQNGNNSIRDTGLRGVDGDMTILKRFSSIQGLCFIFYFR